MKELYIHIGSPKTATTTLQATFRKNRNYFEKKGIYYFKDDAYLAHHHLVWSLRKKFNLPVHGAREEIEEWDIVSQKFLDEIKYTDAQKIILSSEGFFSLAIEAPESITYLKELFKEYKVKIVVYLRRQDKFLESNYSQSIKDLPFETRTISNLLFDVMSRDLYNYYEHLQQWAILFGQSNIIVREFDKGVLINNNILDDFFFSIGADSVEIKDLILVKDKNITPPAEAILLFNILNEFSISSQERFDLYQEIALYFHDKKPHKNNGLLSSVQKKALCVSVYESNRQVANEYLNGKDCFLEYNENEFIDNENNIRENEYNLTVRHLLSKLPGYLLNKIVEFVIFEKRKDYSIISNSLNLKSDNQFFHDRIYDLSHQIESSLNDIDFLKKTIVDLSKSSDVLTSFENDNQFFHDRIYDLSHQVESSLNDIDFLKKAIVDLSKSSDVLTSFENDNQFFHDRIYDLSHQVEFLLKRNESLKNKVLHFFFDKK